MGTAEKPSPEPKPAKAGQREWLAPVLKWVGAVTAVLSLGFGIERLTHLISDYRAENRQRTELLNAGRLQQEASHYAEAWSLFEEAAALDPDDREVRGAREDLAMDWLRNIRVTQGRETFTDIVNRVHPVLSRGAATARGARQADLLAHLGWADFLRSRDGAGGMAPESFYQQALAADAGNAYAHGMWGHWILWNRGPVDEASRHFSAALAGDRNRAYVRTLQLAGLTAHEEPDAELELVRVINEMRKAGEIIQPDYRGLILQVYTRSSGRILSADPSTGFFPTPVPPGEELATYEWLFYGPEADRFDPWGRAYVLGCLQEQAGRREQARRTWQTLLAELTSNTLYERMARAGLARLDG